MSSQEKKINHLLEKIRQENKNLSLSQMSVLQQNSSQSNDNVPPSRPSFSSLASSSRKRPQELTFTTRTNDNLETDRKLKEIMKISGNLTINSVLYKTDIKDMEDLEELGNGTCGHVVKMRHRPSGEIIAVKQMRRSGNSEDNKRIIMDIEVILKSHDCRYIVQCLGCFITDSEVWICMELMTTCFDKLLKRLGRPIPERILGKVTVATVEALSYLKDKHGVIHRDVKPSNILLDIKGYVKLCDFGISGRLKDSMAQTRGTGCAAYLAPERIEPDPKNPDYDIRADVWSLGITLVELATGVFPYHGCNTDFEVLAKVIDQDPPSLPDTFSAEFRDFVKCCLIKDQKRRPKYTKLKNHEFIKKYETENVDVEEWVRNYLHKPDAGANETAPRPSTTQSSNRCFSASHQMQLEDSQNSSQLAGITNGNKQCQYKTLNKPLDANKKDLKQHHWLYGIGSHISRLTTFQSRQRSDHQSFIPVQHQKNVQFQKYPPIQAYHNHLPVTKLNYNTAALQDNSFSSTVRQFDNCCITSPRKQRRSISENRWPSPSSSPLPLRNHFHNEQKHYNCGNTSPIILQRFHHQQKQQQLVKEAEESGKKRFTSNIQLQFNEEKSGRSSRHQSPEPPPRLNRLINGESQSPLAIHRNVLEPANNSPSLTRRYIPLTPPMPPPRRLSESISMPGSPQHFRTRFHYTPEPRRRLFQKNDLS